MGNTFGASVADSSPNQALAMAKRRQRLAVATTGDDEWIADLEELTPVGGSTISDEELATQKRLHDLVKALVALEAAYFEDYGKPLKADCRHALECFMGYSAARLPLLGAEDSGAIVATWVSGVECLSLRFIDRYALHFAVAYQRDGQLQRKWGRSHLATVFGECPESRRLVSAE